MRDSRRTRQMAALAVSAAVLAVIGDMYLKPAIMGAMRAGGRR